MTKEAFTYEKAGVNIAAGEASVQKIKQMVRSTFRPEVLEEIGLFGGFFQPDFSGFRQPVLVASTDGVGTKLKVAIATNHHNTVGEDLVNHCVNDILTSGARPLFFLDYLSLGKVTPEIVAELVSGFVRGCQNASCSLIGGETAEMPDLYQPGEYDMAGTIVGVVDRDRIISGKTIAKGDRLIGLASSGLHTNGYTLARKVFFEHAGLQADSFVPELGQTVGEALLAVHKSYLKVVLSLLDLFKIKGIAHITGGGILGNLSRIVPAGRRIHIEWKSWERPAIFRLIQEFGHVPEEDMRRTFNLGVGMILVVRPEDAQPVVKKAHSLGESAWEVGEIQ